MARLNGEVDISIVVDGAHTVAEMFRHMPPEVVRNTLLITKLFRELGRIANRDIPKPEPVAVFGELFLGAGDALTGSYTEPITGEGAGIVGCMRGVGLVVLDEPIIIGSCGEILAVPAISFDTRDVYLEDGPNLGVANLCPRVAVPLLGQAIGIFRVARVQFSEPN